MKYLSRRILLLSALYICIIFGILAIQFTNGSAFSLSLGAMMVSGTMETGKDGKESLALPLHIAVNGLDFFLDNRSKLMAYTSETNASALAVAGFVKDSTSFTVKFVDGVSVSFTPEKRGDSDVLTISATIPEKYQKIVFPYKLTRSARVEKKDSLTIINTGKSMYVFAGASILPASGSSARYLPLLRSSPVVYYQTWLPAKGLSIEDLASLPGATEAAWHHAIEQYAASALVTFKDAVGAGKLSEPLVADYIAEMGRIGMYHAALDSIPESYRNGSARSYQTNTFLDNLERTWAGLITKEHEDRSAISKKLTENNPAVFEYPSLVPYLVDRGSDILLGDLVRVASGLDMTGVNALQSAGILEAMMDSAVYDPAAANSFNVLADSCERKLKASFVRIGDNLYVSDDGKSIDTRASLRIAQILIRYGDSNPARASWKSAGYLLVTSLASLANDQAVLPAQFALSGGTGTDAKSEIAGVPDQLLSPVVIYPLLVTGNTWYPHALSLASQAGPGVWAWTSAQSIQITKPYENVMKITTRFPQGETHYMVLCGIKPFDRIQIYGMDFRTDPSFEIYNSSGYRYDEKTGTLFLKMRHKAEFEDVVLYQKSSSSSVSAGTSGESGRSPSADAGSSGEN